MVKGNRDIEKLKADLLGRWRAGELTKQEAYAQYVVAVSLLAPTREDALDRLLDARIPGRPARIAGRASSQRLLDPLLSGE